MANDSKTPIMVLQEWSVKHGVAPPQYSIIYAKAGTHENEFHYQVAVDNISAIGRGRSKQVAKHESAINALEILQQRGSYHPDNIPVKAPGAVEDLKPAKLVSNAISTLNEYCQQHKLTTAEFTEISDVGPPHCREFTYQCRVASIKTRATASTKKQAKQLAAQGIIDRLPNIEPEILLSEAEPNTASVKAVSDTTHEALEKYRELKPYDKPKPNLGVKIRNYTDTFKTILEEKELTKEDIEPYLRYGRTEEDLKKFLDQLGLDYRLQTLQENPRIVIVKINTDTPFVVMVMEEDQTTAFECAIQRIFNMTKSFLNL